MNILTDKELDSLRKKCQNEANIAQVATGSFFDIDGKGRAVNIESKTSICHHYISENNFNQEFYMIYAGRGYADTDSKYHKYIDEWYEYLGTFFKGQVIPYDPETKTAAISRNLPGNLVLWWLQCFRCIWEYKDRLSQYVKYRDQGFNPYIAMMLSNCIIKIGSNETIKSAGSVHNPFYLNSIDPKILEEFLEARDITESLEGSKVDSPLQGNRHGVSYLFNSTNKETDDSPFKPILTKGKTRTQKVKGSMFTFISAPLFQQAGDSALEKFLNVLDFKKGVLYS